MNYTENYHLPQWEETDRILRTDFNEAMSNLEEGITEAKATADFPPYVIGTYSGTGSQKTITLGFRPQFLLICKHLSTNVQGDAIASVSGFTGDGRKNSVIITNTGFTIVGSATYPSVNAQYIGYSYIAFR